MDVFKTLTIILFSVGAVQGLVFGGILQKSNNHNRVANQFLAAILFLFSYRLIVQSLRLFGLGYYDIWYYFMLDLSWVSGALLYFYVKALITPHFKLKRNDWIHFFPLVFQIGFSIFVRLQNLYWDGTRESLSWLGYWGYVVWMNYSTIYIVASSLIIFYAIKAQQLLNYPINKVEIDPNRIRWIKMILLAFKYYFLLVLAILIVDLLIYNFTLGNNYFYFIRFYYYPFFIGISILTYWIGMEGFKRKDDKGIVLKTEIPSAKKQQLHQIAQRLEHLMIEQKLYKNPELNLRMVADALEIKPYLLSQTLKEIFHSKFSDYINKLRVEEIRRLIKDPAKQHFTLLTLALEAGFNSKSSFNRSVKKHLGISPSELKAS